MRKKISGFEKLIAIALSFSILGCHFTTDIGLGLGGEGTLSAQFTDTLSIKYSTVLADSTVNSNSPYILSGKIDDPVFGKVEAVAYFQPSLSPIINLDGSIKVDNQGKVVYDTLTLSGLPLIDSVKLRLFSNGLVYGDSMAMSTFRIHRLKQIMDERNYNSDEPQSYEEEPLAEFKINIRSIKELSDGSYNAQFIDLPLSLANEAINAAVDAGGDNGAFIKKFKGFAIVPDPANKAVYGFRTGLLDFSGNNSSLIPYWHYDGDSTAKINILNINGPRYSQYTFDRSGSNLAGLTPEKNEIGFEEAGGRLYLQGGSGISPEIDLSPIKNLGKIKVAKALLEFRSNNALLDDSFNKNNFYVMAEADKNHRQKRSSTGLPYYLLDGKNEIMGNYYILSDSANFLNVDITKYLQKAAQENNFDKSLLLLPATINTTNNLATLSNDNLNRMVFLRPRLLLYYNKE